MIVVCAGCGKSYKGQPGPKPFKCKQCGNRFTFPEASREPATGKRLCSCCWNEVPLQPAELECPACGQRVATPEGGRMKDAGEPAPPASDSASRNEPPADENDARHAEEKHSEVLETRITHVIKKGATLDEKERQRLLRDLRGLAEIRQELETKLHKLQSEVIAERNKAQEAVAERDQAVADVQAAAETLRQTEAQFEEMKAVVAAALEPIPAAFQAGVQPLIQQAGDAAFLVNRVRRALGDAADANARENLQKLDETLAQLEENIRAFQRDYAARLGEVIGGGQAGGENEPVEPEAAQA
ncbi:MAG: hypothetical protein M5U26_24035 [Planctomycetota bacterium]|nr:hypothetical protein [Planctomycetota bacterium]